MRHFNHCNRRLACVFPTLLLLVTIGCTAVSPRPKNTMRTLLHISPTASGIGARDFTRRMDEVTGTRNVPGNRVRLLINGGQGFPAMLRGIENARTRISLASYILRMDRLGKRFVRALAEAAGRKVEVRLLLDAFGSKQLVKADLDGLRRAGAMVRFFNPLDRWTLLRINNRIHRKILVIDGTTAFVGGLNLAKEYDGNGRSGWRDTHLMIKGPAAHELEKVFARSWQQGGSGFLGKDLPVVGVNTIKRALDKPLMQVLGKKHPWQPPAPAADAVVSQVVNTVEPDRGLVPVRIVWSDPDRMASRILDMILLAVNSAHERAWITSGYFVPPRILVRSLVAAARRGVDVRLLLQGVTDEPTTRVLSVGFYGELLGSGVKIYEWRGTVLHAKTVTVDGLWTTIGSCNLDGRALFLNYEANAAVMDRVLAAQMEEQFIRDLENSTPITLADWRQRSFKQKTAEKLLAPVRGQF